MVRTGTDHPRGDIMNGPVPMSIVRPTPAPSVVAGRYLLSLVVLLLVVTGGCAPVAAPVSSSPDVTAERQASAPTLMGEPSPTQGTMPLTAAAPEPTVTAPASATPAAVALETIRVVGTEGQGLRLRGEASFLGSSVRTLPEGASLEVVGPDRQAEGRSWRQVRDPSDGALGWVAAEYTGARAGSAAGSASAPPALAAAPPSAAAPRPPSTAVPLPSPTSTPTNSGAVTRVAPTATPSGPPRVAQPIPTPPPTRGAASTPTVPAPIPGCSPPGLGCGEISAATGRVRDVYVGGYTRRDGTYVRPHYRSRPRR